MWLLHLTRCLNPPAVASRKPITLGGFFYCARMPEGSGRAILREADPSIGWRRRSPVRELSLPRFLVILAGTVTVIRLGRQALGQLCASTWSKALNNHLQHCLLTSSRLVAPWFCVRCELSYRAQNHCAAFIVGLVASKC